MLRKSGNHGDELGASIVWDAINGSLETIDAFISWQTEFTADCLRTVMKLRSSPEGKPPRFLRHDHLQDDRMGRYRAERVVAFCRIVSTKIVAFVEANPSGRKRSRHVEMHG
jgi:hypothetical protein